MSDSESESVETDEELQEKLAKGELKPGLYAIAPHVKKEFVNNTAALKQKLAEMEVDLEWVETLTMVNGLAPLTPELSEQFGDMELKKNRKGDVVRGAAEDAVHHDFKREMAFYRQAQAAVLEGIPRLHELGVVTKRPEDYFAQMAKADTHMTKVREKLLSKKVALERSEKARKMRELKKFGKKVQVEVLQQRQKEKREMMENLKKFKKGHGSLDFLENSGRQKGQKPNAGGNPPGRGKGLTKSQMKRQYKDKKYGYGGQRKRSKFNTASSSADVEGFSRKKHNTAPGAGKKKRLGKSRRKKK
uniref:rRNA-processing protein EBP2 n=1 Tax=Rhipicephalus appendiculatus TaxID=34631 RepID=A0A131YHR6_RHIAP